MKQGVNKLKREWNVEVVERRSLARYIISFFPVFGEWAEHAAIGCASEPAVACIPGKLLLTVPDGLRFVDPPQPLVVGGHHHKKVMEFREGCAHSSVVVGFTPTREPLLGGLKKSGSGFEVSWSHRRDGNGGCKGSGRVLKNDEKR